MTMTDNKISAGGHEVDVVTVELVKNALNGIAQEMQTTLERTAHSQAIREVGDASSALFDVSGRLIAQALSLPVQLAGSSVAVKEILKWCPPDKMREGDVFVLNHAYYGGSHPPDIILVKPYFRNESISGFGCSYAHQVDVGGMLPGSTPPLSTELFQEGLLIPPMRLIDAGQMNETLIAIIQANSRKPDSVMGDIRGQLASLNLGALRYDETLTRFGEETVYRAVASLIERTHVGFRRLIGEIPDGVYAYEDVLDDDGFDDTPIPIRVKITVAGDALTADFTGTAKQVRGSLNCPYANSLSAVYAALKIFLDPRDEIPNNEGCYAAVDIILPQGSLLNPNPPGSVSSRPETQARISNVIMGALGQALPDRAVAQDHGQVAIYRMSGTDPSTGKFFYKSEPLPGGWGGRNGSDGPDVVDFPVANLNNTPVEAMEMQFPLRVERYELRVGSGGDGRFRGGLGLRREIRALAPMDLSVRAERHRFSPRGIFGGGEGEKGAFILTRTDGRTEKLPCKAAGIQLAAGDVLTVLTPGGGGYGPPQERDPALVERDVRQGKVTRS
jgi:N-methylhydantoinase B